MARQQLFQAYVVQNFNGKPYNVVLGDDFKSIKEASDMIYLYAKHFGQCESATIDVAGAEIPTAPEEHETLLETVLKLFK